jgi:hypothetical protein
MLCNGFSPSLRLGRTRTTEPVEQTYPLVLGCPGRQSQLASRERFQQRRAHLASEKHHQHPAGQQTLLLGLDPPALSIQSPRRYHAMRVQVNTQILRPALKHHQQPGQAAHVLPVSQ